MCSTDDNVTVTVTAAEALPANVEWTGKDSIARGP
jgi:hypothetical protein